MNLPVFGSSFAKGCKVLVLAGALFMCAACGSQPEDGSKEAKDDTAVSTDVNVSESASPAAPAADVAADTGKTTSDTSGSSEAASADGTSETSEAAPAAGTDNASASSVSSRAVAKAGPVNDPFRNNFGAAPEKPTSPAASAASAKVAAPGRAAGTAATGSVDVERAPAVKAIPVVQVAKPDIKVMAIFSSSRGSYTAILQAGEETIMVHPGWKSGKYVITNISKKGVTVVHSGKYKWVFPLEKETFGSKGTPDKAAMKGIADSGK